MGSGEFGVKGVSWGVVGGIGGHGAWGGIGEVKGVEGGGGCDRGQGGVVVVVGGWAAVEVVAERDGLAGVGWRVAVVEGAWEVAG